MGTRSTADTIRVADRRLTVSKLYLTGKGQYEIAKATGVTQATISTDLKWLREQWIRSALVAFNERQSIELAKLDRVEAEAWDAWERSKQPIERTTTERVAEGDKDDKPRTKASRVTENRHGDLGALAIVTECIKRRCAIFGLDAPKQLQFMGVVAVTVEQAAPPGLSPDDLVRLADLADRAGVLGPSVTVEAKPAGE
jgi:DNA-binding CsgD family transcriptional regulator